MSNEHLGLYEELRARAKQFEDRDEQRKRMVNLGPAWNGAYSMPVNPFASAIPVRLKVGGYHKHKPKHNLRRRKVFSEARLNINIAQVVQAVCLESGLTTGQLFGPSHAKHVVYPRHVCMWMIDRYCPEYSLPELGYLFQRDHTSVAHGIAKTDKRLRDRHVGTRLLVANIRMRLAALVEGS